METRVPTWTTRSKKIISGDSGEGSAEPRWMRKCWTTTRWLVELTGKNMKIPWTMPSSTASKMVI
jgi:hypothetical protein